MHITATITRVVIAGSIIIGTFLSGSCTVVMPTDGNSRSIYLIGVTRVKVPAQTSPLSTNAYEITGVGVALGRLFQLGYFSEFQAKLTPGSNSALIVVRSHEELQHLERIIFKLNETRLCIIKR